MSPASLGAWEKGRLSFLVLCRCFGGSVVGEVRPLLACSRATMVSFAKRFLLQSSISVCARFAVESIKVLAHHGAVENNVIKVDLPAIQVLVTV